MKKVIRLTENDLTRIVKRVINEMETPSESNKSPKEVERALSKFLNNDEIEFLKNHYEEQGKEGFKTDVKNAVKDINGETELYEEDDMSEEEFKLRDIINKIIKRGSGLAAIGVIPAAMFVSGSAGLALGITALVGLLIKDSAFWNKDGDIHYKELNRSDSDMTGWRE